jgi:hypothetical protein
MPVVALVPLHVRRILPSSKMRKSVSGCPVCCGWPLKRPLRGSRSSGRIRAERVSSVMSSKLLSNSRGRNGPCVDGSELARTFFTPAALVGAAMCSAFERGHMTAGHNALRGSGPGQKLAFDDAMARVGCPDRRIDRLCVTCCSPSQPLHHAGCPARSRLCR